MPFTPRVNDKIFIGNIEYTFTEHPAAPGIPYGQAGRRAIVYQLSNSRGQMRALKVFSLAFRSKRVETQVVDLARYATLPGLSACKRVVISPRIHADLVEKHRDLTYSVLMPWLQGTTWQDLLLNRFPLNKEQSFKLAERLVKVLAVMEKQGLAHCDLSGPNVMINVNSAKSFGEGNNKVALIDLEDLYAQDLQKPEKLPAGSAGYAHSEVRNGIWSADADRFAGAVLIANILAWGDENIRELSYGEQYFENAEMQQDCERKQALSQVLEEHWGNEPARLFNQAWQSISLAECPPLSEWAQVLNIEIPEVKIAPARIPQAAVRQVPIGGPVSGWRTISGDRIDPARYQDEPKVDEVKNEVQEEEFYEYVEWEDMQKLLKGGKPIRKLDQGTPKSSTISASQIEEKNKIRNLPPDKIKNEYYPYQKPTSEEKPSELVPITLFVIGLLFIFGLIIIAIFG